MRKPSEVKVVDSFHISNLGIIVFLENVKQGLTTGTVLKSKESDESWVVKSRMIEFPHIEKPFDNETVLNSHLHFSTPGKRIQAENKISERQQNKIYQYLLEGDKKPETNEVLHIIEQ